MSKTELNIDASSPNRFKSVLDLENVSKSAAAVVSKNDKSPKEPIKRNKTASPGYNDIQTESGVALEESKLDAYEVDDPEPARGDYGPED